MDENVEFYTTYRKVISISWVIMITVCVILAIVSLIFFPSEWYKLSLSYLLGAMTNIFAFNLLKNNISNISSDAKRSISGSFSNYTIRFMIYAFVLFISIKNEKLNPFAVASGFITVRLAIYIYSWLKKRERR